MSPGDLNAIEYLCGAGMLPSEAEEFVRGMTAQREQALEPLRLALRELIDLARVRSLYPNEMVRFEMVLRR